MDIGASEQRHRLINENTHAVRKLAAFLMELWLEASTNHFINHQLGKSAERHTYISVAACANGVWLKD
jgi:hypothetical protein